MPQFETINEPSLREHVGVLASHSALLRDAIDLIHDLHKELEPANAQRYDARVAAFVRIYRDVA